MNKTTAVRICGQIQVNVCSVEELFVIYCRHEVHLCNIIGKRVLPGDCQRFNNTKC